MRARSFFISTLKEAPADADVISQQYMIRAGMIKKLAAGVYTYMPVGLRVIRKIEAIIREEMVRAGSVELLMPIVQPAELWQETGRWNKYGPELLRIKDRHNRDFIIQPTSEEVATDVIRQEIRSWRQLPLNIFHIQTKFRDDPRPRAGLIRVREFTMLDSYSFDKDYEGLDKVYRDHYRAYFRIFSRCALPSIAVGADSGMMGGKVSHEYMYLSPIGEDTIIYCDKCGYTANRQIAKFRKEYYKEDMLPMEKVATPESKTIEELASYLNIDPKKTAKCVFMVGTFINDTNGEEEEKLIVALVRGDLEVEESKLSNAAKANSIRPAHEEEITACSMVPGYASPIGATGSFICIVDDSVAESNNLVAGANEAGYHYLNTNFGRDYQGIVCDIASAREGMTCPECGEPLRSSKGVEIGNIFQLGTRYSESMNCTYQDENGKQIPVVMGSYGIGVGRLLACLAEEYNDESGLKLPMPVAPYQVHLVSLVKDPAVADRIYEELTRKGIDVLYDDRNETAGVKFADADLIGIPIRLTLGSRSLKEGKVEVRLRSTGETSSYLIDDIAEEVKAEIDREIKAIEDKVVEKEL